MDEMVGLIPAAGGGTRLLPFSKAIPKEMYPILGKAAIEHCIENMKLGGITKIFLIVGHQKGALIDYMGNGSHFGVDIAYIYQQERKGLGHAILQARQWIDKPFVVILGDSFIEPKEELVQVIDHHKRTEAVATMLVFEVERPEGYGIVKVTGNRVEDLVEKPSLDQAQSLKSEGKFLASTGVYSFSPKIFDYLDRTPAGVNQEVQITDAIRLAVKAGENVQAVVLKGRYLDIGKWKTVLSVEKEFSKNMDLEATVEERETLMRKMNQEEQ